MSVEYGYLSYVATYGSNSLIHGNEITPNEDITITGLRGYTKSARTGSLRIGTTSEILETIDNVTFTAETWVDANLSAPMTLTAGTTYIVQVVVSGSSTGTVAYTHDAPSINTKISNPGNGRWGGFPGTLDSNTWAGADIIIDTTPPVPPPSTGFEIHLMNNTEELNKISKNPTLVSTLTGFLRDETNIIDPEIIIEFDGAFVTCNYMYIPVFNRYYFITDIESVRTKLWRIKAHCDVLKTYSEGLLNTEAVIARNEGLYNLYLNDDMFKVYTNPRLQIAKFPNKFTGESYVLVMNGAKYT